MLKAKQRRGQRKPSAWSRGETRNAEGLTFKDVARAQLRLINSRRQRLPRCSAMAKSTGEPCRHLAMGNGKCRVHGGATPSGDDWHVRQYPRSGTKAALRKWDAKVEKAEIEARARRLRLKRATEAERAAYDIWLTSHPSGSAALRVERRLRRRIAEEKRDLDADVRRQPQRPDVQDLIDRIEKLKAQRALINAYRTGVFS